jgi:hypothetical protein
MTTLTLESGDFGWDYLLVAEDGRDVLVQTDWDYPGVALNLGWAPSKVTRQTHCHVTPGEPHDCDEYYEHRNGPGDYSEDCPDCCTHEGTDGTVGCKCGVTASEFIADAQQWLDDHIGESFEDPGYLGTE